VRLGNLALGIYNQGQRALPHGTCPGVGVGGHFTHGGYGYDSRLWGLGLDTIVGMDVVLADGEFVHVTATNCSELFYALRGAAESFGVVTTFYLQTLPAPSSVINFSVGLSAVLKSASLAAKTFLSLQDFVLNSPLMNRNISFGIYTDGTAFTLSGWYFGDETYFRQKILPNMLAGFPAASSTTIASLSWLDSLVNEAGGPLRQPLTGYSAHNSFYAKSIVTHNAQPLTAGALKSFFNYVITKGRASPISWFTIINLYGGIDSQINSIPATASAYSDRDALWVFQIYGSASSAPLPPAVDRLVAGLSAALTTAQPSGDFGAYLNYIDPALTPVQAALLYYGRDTYARLRALKQKFDPLALFWNPLAVGTADLGGDTATTTSALPMPTPTPMSSPDGSCAANSEGGYTCSGAAVGGACCSQWGWCGDGPAYCGSGCQRDFGRCDE
jgi:Berberine and berberine like/FAD binding domain/Chitin recognition protein